MSTPAVLAERTWLSRYTPQAPLVLVVHQAGQPAAADGEVVATMTRLVVNPGDVETVIFTDRVATHEGNGHYIVTLTSADTASPGLYQIGWEYTLDGTEQGVVTYVEVGESAPEYDALPPEYKQVVEDVWVRFQDVYDSPLGGPYLQTNLQGGFGRNRMAQLLRTALGKLNTVAQPITTYGYGQDYDGHKLFPLGSHASLLEAGLSIEVLKHLRRSYVEQPSMQGVPVARADRRDYLARWGDILRDEDQEYRRMLDGFKIAHMGLGRVQVAVAGGLYTRLRINLPLSRGALVAKGLWQVFHP